MSKARLALVTAALVLWVESASAVTLPFYLTLNGTNGGIVFPPSGSTVYQLWVDPSAIAGGTFGIDATIVSSKGQFNNALTMTAFAGIAANGTTANLNTTTQTLAIVSGDAINGNSVPFEIGTLTIANSSSAIGDITLWTGDYIDSNFATNPATAPQILAFAEAPEPGTLLLLGAGLGGLAAIVRARRLRVR